MLPEHNKEAFFNTEANYRRTKKMRRGRSLRSRIAVP